VGEGSGVIKFLDLHQQYVGIKAEIDQAIERVVRNCEFIGGSEVAAFEEAFAKYQDVRHCVGVGNGTDALEIALEALCLPPQSEVIVPANSFIATSEAVTRAGHIVKFADVDPVCFGADPASVRSLITPRTAAVIAVHLYGHPCNVDGLMDVCREHQLHLLEDCAQAHGATIHGRRVGTFGSAAAFSFYPGKNLGAYGDAGAILTNDGEVAEKCRMIANHGRLQKYDHKFEGRNSRLDALQAAILAVKLQHLDRWLAARRAVAAIYESGLQGLKDLVLPATRAGAEHAFHLFVIRTSFRDGLRQFLADKGIQTGIHYPTSLPMLRAYRGKFGARTAPIATALSKQILSLPIGEHLCPAEAEFVVETIRQFFERANAMQAPLEA
jgi:dTDP-4-amino-4,6-dideoxygalactose transaminase